MFENLVKILGKMGVLEANEKQAFSGQYYDYDGTEHGEYFPIVIVRTDLDFPVSLIDGICKKRRLVYDSRLLYGRREKLFTIWHTEDRKKARRLDEISRTFLDAYWKEHNRQYILSGRNDGILPNADIMACHNAGKKAIENMEV